MEESDDTAPKCVKLENQDNNENNEENTDSECVTKKAIREEERVMEKVPSRRGTGNNGQIQLW